MLVPLCLCKAMNKKAKRLGLTRLLRENNFAKKVVKMAMALPLLPPDQVQVGFNAIEQFAAANNLAVEMGQFILYVQRVWIDGVGAPAFSVYRQRRRTNNDMEAYHRVLTRKIGLPHPDVWTFTDGLRKFEKASTQRFLSLQRGLNAARPQRRQYIICDQRLSSATRRLERGDYTVENFLQVASYSLSNIMNNVLADDDEADDGDIGVAENVLPLPLDHIDEEVIDDPEAPAIAAVAAAAVAAAAVRGGMGRGRGGRRGGANHRLNVHPAIRGARGGRRGGGRRGGRLGGNNPNDVPGPANGLAAAAVIVAEPLQGPAAAAAPEPLEGPPAAAAPEPLQGPAAAAPPELVEGPAAAVAPEPLEGPAAAAAPEPLEGPAAAAAPEPLAGPADAEAPEPLQGPAAAEPVEGLGEHGGGEAVTHGFGRCTVCINLPATHVVNPCGHVCMCQDCAEELPHHVDEDNPLRCPVCRAFVISMFRIFV